MIRRVSVAPSENSCCLPSQGDELDSDEKATTAYVGKERRADGDSHRDAGLL